MRASELDYTLPEELIAQRPLEERDGARLLVLGRAGGELSHESVRSLPRLLPPALFVVNDTRVRRARLRMTKASGGHAELLLVERLPDGRWLALGRASKGLPPGTQLRAGDLHAAVDSRTQAGQLVVSLSALGPLDEALEDAGEVPLPPYIRRAPTREDSERYQTVYASELGSVAAPTAGLHFSGRLLAALVAHGHLVAHITLHVGPATFAPIRCEQLSEHRMHAERYVIPESTAAAISDARAAGRAVVAVGTTVVRALESSARAHGTVWAGAGETAIFIYPPYHFRAVDTLMTNFHLPRSTLLALVMAFGGVEAVERAYTAAVRGRYRFYSYGDAMLVL